jgi:hypothetical protein
VLSPCVKSFLDHPDGRRVAVDQDGPVPSQSGGDAGSAAASKWVEHKAIQGHVDAVEMRE